VTRGVAAWAYFTVRAIAQTLALKGTARSTISRWTRTRRCYPSLIQGQPHLAPGAQLRDKMLEGGPAREPFEDKR
jgi:hypothetical protein